MQTASKNGIEVSREEWDSRTLSSYGYFASLIDLMLMVLYLGAIGNISIYIIPALSTQGESIFWYCLVTIFFVLGLKTAMKVFNPINSYQTVIVRK